MARGVAGEPGYVKITDGWYWFKDGNGVAIQHRFERPRKSVSWDKAGASPTVEVREEQYFSNLLSALQYASDRNAQNATALKDILPRMRIFKAELDAYFKGDASG